MVVASRRPLRVLLPLVGLTAAALALGGCSSSGQTPAASPTSFDGVDLTVWNNIDFEPYQGLQKQYFESCAKDLGITVKVETVTGGYSSKLLQAASSKSLPDVMMLSSDIDVPTLASQGVLADLGKLGLSTEGMDAKVAALGTQDGTLYGLPVQVEVYALFYNQAAFDKAGVDSFPTTFDGVADLAAKMSGGGDYGMVLPGLSGDGSTAAYFLPLLLSAGGDPSDPTGAGAVAAVDFYKKLVDGGGMSKEFVNWGWDSIDQWKGGKAAITVSGPWNLVDTSLKPYGTAQLPTVAEGDKPVANLLGYNYGVAVQSDPKREQAAAALISCRASEANQVEMAEKGGYIPALTAAQKTFVEKVPAAASFVDAVPNSFNAATLGTKWNTLQQVYVDAIQNATTHGVSAADALAQAVAANQ